MMSPEDRPTPGGSRGRAKGRFNAGTHPRRDRSQRQLTQGYLDALGRLYSGTAPTPSRATEHRCRNCGVPFNRPPGRPWTLCRTCWGWLRHRDAIHAAAQALRSDGDG